MGAATDTFKGASVFLPSGVAVPGAGEAAKIGPDGNAFVSTHTFSNLTEYDFRVEITDGNNNWMPIPYAYVKGGTPDDRGVVTLKLLPNGHYIRAYVTRITGADAVVSVSVLTGG